MRKRVSKEYNERVREIVREGERMRKRVSKTYRERVRKMVKKERV